MHLDEEEKKQTFENTLIMQQVTFMTQEMIFLRNSDNKIRLRKNISCFAEIFLSQLFNS